MASSTTIHRYRSPTRALPKQGATDAARLAAEISRAESRRHEHAHPPGDPEMLRDDQVRIGESDADIEKLRAERDEYLDLARRERAEFDNYRKRVTRDMGNIKRDSLAAFLKDLFGPLDDLDRALTESAKDESFEALQSGVRIIGENLWKVLANAGVKKINAKGKPFNPEFHEAMAAVPATDVPPNTVIEVFENGYKLDGFVLRPARVVVSTES